MTDAEKWIVGLERDFAPHCNCQLWLPDEDSEAQLYSGDDRHGAMLTGLPVASDLTKAYEKDQIRVRDNATFRRTG